MSRVLRASAIMAAGTMVSRVTGFVRSAVLVAALGSAQMGDAYTVANMIPFILFDYLLGGVLSSVVVPSIVRRQKTDPDGGRAYEQRLMTAGVLGLVALTVIAVLLARPLIGLYTTTGARSGSRSRSRWPATSCRRSPSSASGRSPGRSSTPATGSPPRCGRRC